MNRIVFLRVFAALLFAAAVLQAQVPQGIKYQAAARSAQGSALPNQDIAVRFSILQGTPGGSAVYEETHTATTNALGLFSLNIGMGAPILGSFDGIRWEDSQYFVKVEIDPQGGTAYIDMGTTQLLSVPYAQVARKSILSQGIDVDTVGVAPGDVLKWNNGGWVVAPDDGSGGGDNDWSFPPGPNPAEMWATNTAGDVLIGRQSPGNGSKLQIRNTDAQPKEVDILTPQGDGVNIGVVGRHGIHIQGPAQQNAIHIDGNSVVQGDGVAIANVNRHGVSISNVKQNGVNIEDIDGTGVNIQSTGGPGMIVEGAGMEGIRINGPVADNAITIKSGDAEMIGNAGLEVGGTGSHALFVNDDGGTIGGDGLRIEGKSDGGLKGHGVYVKQSDAANKNHGIQVSVASDDDFDAFAVHGIKALTNRISTKSAAVGGEAGKGPGVLGISEEGDGVAGYYIGSSNFNDGPNKLRSGIHGYAPTNSESAGNFAVVGSGESYGSGVLGIGGVEQGWGVYGISPRLPGNATNAGVRGSTAEDTWPFWEIEYGSGGKKSIGVYGQAREYVGVWGESLNNTGVVGTAGIPMTLDDVNVEGKAGVAGISGMAGAEGVFGMADSASGVKGTSYSVEETKAGVWAKGNGVTAPGSPKAAALKIDNGAITVTGTNQPAGVITVSPVWVENYGFTGGCPDCKHNHRQGFTSNPIPWQHPLLRANSIILLTTESNLVPVFAQVFTRGNGAAQLHVYTTWCIDPPTEVQIHFMIVNPVAE